MKYLDNEKVMEMMQWEFDALPEYSGTDATGLRLNAPLEEGKWKRLQAGLDDEDDYWMLGERRSQVVTWYKKIRIVPNRYKVISDGTADGTWVTGPDGNRIGLMHKLEIFIGGEHSHVTARITLLDVKLDVELRPDTVESGKIGMDEMRKDPNIPCDSKK
jgi:hypothetical protein